MTAILAHINLAIVSNVISKNVVMCIYEKMETYWQFMSIFRTIRD